MQLVDLSKPGEKKKLIWAAGLGLVAIIFLWWTLIGFGSSTPTANNVRPAATPTPATATPVPAANNNTAPADFSAFTTIDFKRPSYSAPEARRNIFAYYAPPVPTPKPSEAAPTPVPSPPPILLASISPSNVYARTADFKLEAAGDKFTPAMRVVVDGRELPTSYKSPQQLSATVSAALITSPGTRNVMVRTPDGTLYSNQLSINVAAAPTPNYTYIGIIGRPNRVDDIALVQERNNKNIMNVLRGDVLSGRFRVTSISDKELVLVDTTLKIKHTIAMSEGDKSGGPLARPTPRVDSEDDEP
ncbi:MAG TPA: hypothetical protein VN644_07165 [Pyrinomonadaceae bacterium]|nr:hypothetical protein [Pyrinomonadaceae bacterium]